MLDRLKNISHLPALVTGLVCLVVLGSCRTTRRIPEGEQLYTGVKKIEIAAPKGEKIPAGVEEQLREVVAVKPNASIFGSAKYTWPWPVGLWIYNSCGGAKKGFKHWLFEKLGREPVLLSDVRPGIRTHMVDEILDNNGYFHGSASYELIEQKNPKKVKVSYQIETGSPYTIASVQLLPDTCTLYHYIDSVARLDPYLKAGERYCTDSLSASRIRIANALRNRGYYFFRPDYIEYLADSLQSPGQISLMMMLANNLPKMVLERYKIGKVTMYALRHKGGGTPDTIPTSRATLIQMKPSRLRTQIVPECVTLREGSYLSVRRLNSTQTRLARLGIFQGIDMEVIPDTLAAEPTVNVDISCTFDTPLEATIEVNASSKSNSYMGPGVVLGLTNRNIFGGGEQLGVTLNGNYEWQTGGHGSLFNSYEVGITTTLAIPRMLAPRFIKRLNRNLNWTRFSLNADLLNRPHYFKMAQFNVSMTYDWQSSRYSSHSFTPFKLTYTKLLNSTHEFDSITHANPAIALSFRSQYIPQMLYTYIWDRAVDADNTLNWQFTVQQAGNLFWCIYEACGSKGEKRLFGNPFSQFVKGTTQLVWGRRLFGSGAHWLVSRVGLGIEHAYGNSKEVPYAEQFYIGGANSIRAFTVRSLGPGSYRPPKEVRDGYFDQTGTFKLEMNVEYRFPIFGPLHGAIFVDAGNIWLLKQDPLRPGGQLRAKTFLKDIALGTGAGLRFDFGVIVLRGDLGIGIHAPYRTRRHGYYNMTSFGRSLAFHLAIGYPF